MALAGRKNGRHTPAFILLFLAEAPANGAEILKKLETRLPFCFSDSPGVYRALQKLESEGSVITSWEPMGTKNPRKVYQITPAGYQALVTYADDIAQRVENLGVFLAQWAQLQGPKPN